MQQKRLPEHPAAQEEYLHLQQVRDAIEREIGEVEALTGAKAGVVMDVQMKEDPDQQEEVTMQLFQGQLDRLRQLNMARGQAYFARLGFIPEGSGEETWYLGRWGVLNPVTLDPVVVDWRSPVANLYYSGQVGPMDYEAPDGQIRGELTLKRMLTVRDRELEGLFDSGIVSQEAYLQGVLGSISSDRLKDIVTTIQAEQNIVIRYPLSDNLLVQGAAGSGKTTIALAARRKQDSISAMRFTGHECFRLQRKDKKVIIKMALRLLEPYSRNQDSTTHLGKSNIMRDTSILLQTAME